MLTGILLGAFLGYFIPLMVARFADEYIERHLAAADHQAALDEHIAQALRLAEPTPIYDQLACDEIEKAEGWKA